MGIWKIEREKMLDVIIEKWKWFIPTVDVYCVKYFSSSYVHFQFRLDAN